MGKIDGKKFRLNSKAQPQLPRQEMPEQPKKEGEPAVETAPQVKVEDTSTTAQPSTTPERTQTEEAAE